VRLRLTIGADGRVKAVRRLAASSDAFWSATERHARARWRFRPATLDGRPIESSKVMTVFFRIDA
jgi:protein TonB